MKKSPHKIHKTRELGKAQNPDPQNRQRGVENERNEKIPLEQKAGDPLGERTIASSRSAGVLNSSWPPALVAA
jgi:hypothetical protein